MIAQDTQAPKYRDMENAFYDGIKLHPVPGDVVLVAAGKRGKIVKIGSSRLLVELEGGELLAVTLRDLTFSSRQVSAKS